MGLMRLLVPSSSRITPQQAERAYLAAPDQTPWACRSRLVGHELQIERNVSDSGTLVMPFTVAARGEIALSSASLMEREAPYHLPVELARGKINSIRAQISEWQGLNMAVPADISAGLKHAMLQLAQAATSQHDVEAAGKYAEVAIRSALTVADKLSEAFIEQALVFRKRETPQLPTLLGCDLGLGPPVRTMAGRVVKNFNFAQVPLIWRDVEPQEGAYQWESFDKQIEWCYSSGLKTCAGPLLPLDRSGLPDWLYLWEGDFENVLSFVSDYVETVVSRYRGKVGLWQCASKANLANVLSLREEHALRLAARALEIIRALDPDTPTLVRFDQPWGEYMRRSEHDYSPLQFADSLVRGGMPVAAIGIDLNFGYEPGGSYLRDRLELSRMLDWWSSLGLPLFIFLTIPSDTAPDPLARSKAQPVDDGLEGGWTQQRQRMLVKYLLPLLLARPAVNGIVWNQLSDGEPHSLAHGGLFDTSGEPKLALRTLGNLRRKHLA